MKKADLYSFKQGLEQSMFSHPRVTYAINKNKRLVRQTIKDMEVYIEANKDMTEFMEARIELAKQHSNKDEKGNPRTKIVPGNKQSVYDVKGQDDENSDYRKALSKLEKKYAVAIDEQREKERLYNEEFLLDETDFVPHRIPIDFIFKHETSCPQHVMDKIFWMLEEEEIPIRKLTKN